MDTYADVQHTQKTHEKAFFVTLSLSCVHLSVSVCLSVPLSLCLPLSAHSYTVSSPPLGTETLSLSDLMPAHLVDFVSVWQGVMETCRKALTNR